MFFLIRGTMTKLPFQDGTFDALQCVGAIWHLQKGDEDAFAQEAFRVLKDNGKLVITAQAGRAVGSDRFGKLVSFLWNLSPLQKKIQLNKFSESYIALLLQRYGFITNIDICSSLGFPWKVVIATKENNE